MRPFFLVLFFLLPPAFAGAQAISINTDGSNPDPSAILDVKSTDKGMLVPRMTTAQRIAIAAPATGLLVFDTDTGSFWFFSGAVWINLVSPATLTDADGDTKIQVEKSPDEDVIRMDLVGSERLVLQQNAAGNTLIGLPGNNQNVFIGNAAGGSNTTGIANTALGEEALFANIEGYSNTAIGANALRSNTYGIDNTATGSSALYSAQSGSYNTANGQEALFSNTNGNSNVAIGGFALHQNTDRSNLVALGDSALYNNGTDASAASHAIANTAVGSKALLSNTTGSNNTAQGFQTLFSNTTGSNNSAIGYQALFSNMTASFNTAQGYQALYSNTTGSGNTAVGVQALFRNITGGSNTALGLTALSGNTEGSRNTAAGLEALSFNTTGSDNTALGVDALVFNTSGYSNTAMGKDALRGNFSGFNNTATGFLALKDNVNGLNNTSIGSFSYFTGGNLSNTTSLGYFSGGVSNVSNRIEIGNLSVSWIGGQVGWSTYSDARIKTQVRENVPGLDFITKLRPVTYHLDIHRQNDLCFNEKKDPGEWAGMYDIEQRQFTGFIAQEVEAAARSVGYDFSGVERAADELGMYSVRYSDFVMPLVKAVQEQQAQIEAQAAKTAKLETENAALKAQLDKITAALQTAGINLENR